MATAGRMVAAQSCGGVKQRETASGLGPGKSEEASQRRSRCA